MPPKEKTPAPPDLSLTRRIELEPHDWLWATWRPRPDPVIPRPRPFKLAVCVDRLKNRVVQAQPGGEWDWRQLHIDSRPSRDEAHFWFLALTAPRRQTTPQQLADALAATPLGGPVTPEEVADRSRAADLRIANESWLLAEAIAALLPPADYVRFLVHPSFTQLPDHLQIQAGHWWETDVVYRLTREDIAILTRVLPPEVTVDRWPGDNRIGPPLACYIAARLGMHAEMRALVESWPAERYAEDNGGAHVPQLIVFGLGSAAEVERHFRRLGLRLRGVEQVRAWIAHTEHTALDVVFEAVLSTDRTYQVQGYLNTLCNAIAPEVAPYLLRARLETPCGATARRWLEAYAGVAIAGLIPVAAGRGKLADAAIRYLRDARPKGLAGFIEEQLRLVPAEVAEPVRRSVFAEGKSYRPITNEETPEWLLAALSATRVVPRLPEWLDPAVLPPIPLTGDTCLNPSQVGTLLAVLRSSPLHAPGVLLMALRRRGDPDALDAFAWDLFERWRDEGGPTKDKWAMHAVGHLGSDASVVRLAPMIRAWPEERQNARAVLGLQCLAAIGTDSALMAISGIAQKMRVRRVREQARALLNDIARVRGISQADLEDLIVPTLDLDDNGSRVFDYGPRRFTFVLGQDLSPQVRDEAGKVRKDLPKPGTKDDPAKAQPTQAAWKLLKKQLREVLRTQATRLEQALVAGRRWKTDSFERLLVRHPLMGHLVRRLLWGGFDEGGQRRATFRLTEEREWVGPDDRAVSVKEFAQVGLVHPVELSDAERTAWGTVFGDYELVSPFPQLGRPIFRLEPGEEAQTSLTRFEKVKVPGVVVWSRLEAAGWSRGPLGSHGNYHQHDRFFPIGQVTAVVKYEPGLNAGDLQSEDEQRIVACRFYPAAPPAVEKDEPPTALPLGQVHAVVLSEVLADLHALAARGVRGAPG